MRGLLAAVATLAFGLATVDAGAADDGVSGGGVSGGRASSARVEASDIRVGDLLEAVRDVSLDEAIIAEGSKVSVSGKRSASGNVLLDVALADGHVVRGVPLAEIRKSFRRVAQ